MTPPIHDRQQALEITSAVLDRIKPGDKDWRNRATLRIVEELGIGQPVSEVERLREELATERERTNPAILRERIAKRLRRLTDFAEGHDDPDSLSISEMVADHEQALERLREMSRPCAEGGCQFGPQSERAERAEERLRTCEHFLKGDAHHHMQTVAGRIRLYATNGLRADEPGLLDLADELSQSCTRLRAVLSVGQEQDKVPPPQSVPKLPDTIWNLERRPPSGSDRSR